MASQDNTSSVVTFITDERNLRALLRSSIRACCAMTRNEELNIEDEFVRRARKAESPSTSVENQARVVALLDQVLARANSTDPDQTDTGFRNFARRRLIQCRELLSDTHFEGGAFVADRGIGGHAEARS
jgi:hypothetical protein